ncbi:MAG: hypothetical protein SF053_05845 [Bacteroidia bacterium]|nr:hypothetical protein [Bacteroidia bacterium]
MSSLLIFLIAGLFSHPSGPAAPQPSSVNVEVMMNSGTQVLAAFSRPLPRTNFSGAITIESANPSQGGAFTVSNRTYSFFMETLDQIRVSVSSTRQPLRVIAAANQAGTALVALNAADPLLDLGPVRHANPSVGHKVYAICPQAPIGSPLKNPLYVLPGAGEGVIRTDLRSMLPERTIMRFEVRDNQRNLLRRYTFTLTADQQLGIVAEGPTGPAALTTEAIRNSRDVYVRLVTLK